MSFFSQLATSSAALVEEVSLEPTPAVNTDIRSVPRKGLCEIAVVR